MHLRHPRQTPVLTRTEGSFSYQGVSKGGVWALASVCFWMGFVKSLLQSPPFTKPPFANPPFKGPRGPKDWKNSRCRSRIETFKRPISDRDFQSRLKISGGPHSKAPFVGNHQGRDWKFQSRWKSSIEIENFNLPKGPSPTKTLRRGNFGTGSKFGTDVATRYTERAQKCLFI